MPRKKPTATEAALAALKPEDCDVLAAAGAGLLTADSRFTGTIHELRYLRTPGDLGGGQRVPVRQARRLRDDLELIAASAQVEHCRPARPELSTSGREYTVTTMTLTPRGLAVIAALSSGAVAA